MVEIKAVIFDADGTLWPEDYIQHAELETLHQFGIPATSADLARLTGINFATEATILSYGKTTLKPETFTQMLAVQRGKVIKGYREIIQPFENVEEVLKTLAKDYSLGLATSRDRIAAKIMLQRCNLLQYFMACTYGDEVEKGKPHPEIIIKTLYSLDPNPEFLSIEPANCVVVGDSNLDVRAAKRAKAFAIVSRADHNKDINFAEANCVVEDMRKIPEILFRLNHRAQPSTFSTG